MSDGLSVAQQDGSSNKRRQVLYLSLNLSSKGREDITPFKKKNIIFDARSDVELDK